MSIIYLLISISVFVAGVFLFLFIRSVKAGQFDDAYTPSVRMLFDDELKVVKKNTETTDKRQNKKENQI